MTSLKLHAWLMLRSMWDWGWVGGWDVMIAIGICYTAGFRAQSTQCTVVKWMPALMTTCTVGCAGIHMFHMIWAWLNAWRNLDTWRATSEKFLFSGPLHLRMLKSVKSDNSDEPLKNPEPCFSRECAVCWDSLLTSCSVPAFRLLWLFSNKFRKKFAVMQRWL